MIDKSAENVLFSWIHLSDIHFLHGNQTYQVDQEMILQALINEVEMAVSTPSTSLPKPDAIFITGDVAFSGGEKDINEYANAEQWLIKLKDALRLSKYDIFIFPGNHDIQRSIYIDDDDVSLLLDSLREDRRNLEWALNDEKQRNRLSSRLDNFIEFSSKFRNDFRDKDNKYEKLFWQGNLSVGTKFGVRLIGLNTALLSQDDADKGNLNLSLHQLKEVPDLIDGSNELCIALSHHPLSWLADGETVEGWLRKKAHIHLFGHIHDPESVSYQSGAGSSLVRIQADALHKDQRSERSSNCFNFAAVVANPNGQVFVRVWNRIWSEKHKDFRDDPESHPKDKPYAEHKLQDQYFSPQIYESTIKNVSVESSSFPQVFIRKHQFICDSPPLVDIFVGRESDLSVFNHFQSGVIAVTGIGGQGKSAFASKFLEKWRAANPSYFWDWRDCRELREQFHTNLISIIENVTNGKVSGTQLEGAEIKELVRIFFDVVNGINGLVVLDNVDNYVDVSTGKFTIGVEKFVEAALQYKHKLIIIITCRPRINYASPNFLEIHLKGISVDDAVDLFKLRGVRFEGEDLVTAVHKIHALTDGHPLWLNLIGTQVANKLARLEDIIADIEKGQVDDRAKTMMRAIWKGLNYRQEVILRYMAELTRPDDIDWIYNCVSDEIKTWNQFSRAFKSLKNLDLIIETLGIRDKREFDLHPIVRNFIKTEFYSRKEREPVLDRVIWVVDSFISKCAKKITILTPISLLQYWILKAELALRKEDFQTACVTLSKIGEKLVLRGIPGELFRVGETLLDQCVGKHEKLIDFEEFHNLNRLLGHTYAEYGRKEDAKKHVERYLSLVPINTAHYIAACNVRCYVEWMFQNYDEAIFWGNEGISIKRNSNIDTLHDTSHTLALALRDKGKIEEALKIFLECYTIESVIGKEIQDKKKNAAYFGNIGRCLQFKGLNDQALHCFVKSANILGKEEESVSILNRGYACLWIGEVLEAKGDLTTAYLFYKRAECIWLQRAPLKAEEPGKRLSQLFERIQGSDVLRMTEAGIEREVRQWLQSFENN